MTGYLKDRPPTTENLFQWLRHRLAVERVSTGTLGEDRKYANKFFKWCVANRRLSENPLDPIPKIAVKITRRAVITDEQFEALKRAAMGNDLGFYGMIVVAWYTGMRLSDICGLRWDSIDWPTQVLTFVPRKTQRSGRTVELKLSGEIWDVLYERHRLLSGGEGDNHVNGPFVFDEAKQLYDRQNGDIQRQFRQLCSRAGLPKTITFHCFRHTRTTRMLNSDNPVDPLTAADFLGLSSLDTLRGYNHASLARKEKAMNL